MCDASRLEHPRVCQFNGRRSQMLEQAHPITQKDRDEVNPQFVKQSRA